MSIGWRRLAAIVLCLGAASCGGGGGGSGAVTPAVVFTPGRLVVETDPGVSATMSVTARPTFSTSGTVYVVVIDTRGVINPSLTLTPQSDGSYLASLSTAATLAVGRYTGELEVRVCPVANCAQQFAGSPVALPYDITVGVTPNLTPLARIPGAPDWETHQGNAAHSGHVPITLDASRFSTRWRWVSTDTDTTPSAPVIAGDTVYVVTSGYFAAVNRLHALREADAATRWSHNFGSLFAVNPPAVAGNAVYAASTGHGDTAMWSFAADTGAVRFRSPFGSQWEHYYAPTVIDGGVYTDGGSYGGLQAFDAANGTATWFAGTLAQYDQWTPAVDASYAYANVGGTLSVLHRADGSVAQQHTLPGFSWNGWSSHAMAVLAGNGKVLARSGGGFSANAATNTLNLVDTGAAAMAWSVTGPFVTDPVVANGVVYIANSAPLQLEARSVATGQVQWTWPLADAADTGFLGNLVVTDSHLFASTNRRTYAIDLATHATAWSHGKPGWKAISANGVMAITTLNAGGGADRGVTAINLR